MILFVRTLTAPITSRKEYVIGNDTYYVTFQGKRFYKDSLLEVGYRPLHKAYLTKEALQADIANIKKQMALRSVLPIINPHTLSNEDVEAMLNICNKYGRPRRRNGILSNTKSRSPKKALADN